MIDKNTNIFNIKETRRTLFNRLPSCWQSELQFLLLSSDFDDILTFLKSEVVEHDRRFSPALGQIFRPLIECPLNQVKVVFLNSSPYLNPHLNNGLCLDVNTPNTPGIGYFRFRAELLKEYPQAICKLSELPKQGILMLNGSPTMEILKYNYNHVKKWLPILYKIINILNQKDVLWVVFGSVQGSEKINPNHTVFEVKGLPERRDQSWSSEGIFKNINEQLKLKNKSEISW